MENNQNLIEFKNVSKVYGGQWWSAQKKVRAVSDLSFSIPSGGSIFGLLGPNGSGKTTTIKMLLGLIPPTSGSISLFAQTPLKNNTKIGYLLEKSLLHPHLTPRENLQLTGHLYGLPVKVINERVEYLLKMVGLEQLNNRALSTFSKGMTRRLAILRTLIHNPQLIILDEPLDGLDPIGAQTVKHFIKQLAAKNKTILICSHILSDMQWLCDEIMILHGGQKIVQGTCDDLLQPLDQSSPKVVVAKETLEDLFIREVQSHTKKGLKTQGAQITPLSPNHLDVKKTAQAVDTDYLNQLTK